MRRRQFSFGYGCSDRLLLVAVVIAAFTVGLKTGATAQYVELPLGVGQHAPMVTPPPTITPVPSLTPSLTPSLAPSLAPAISPSTAAPAVAAPVAAPAPRSVRFRCEVLPQDQSCREHSETPDGDAHDDQCDCSRDYCYPAPDGNRVCEKLQ